MRSQVVDGGITSGSCSRFFFDPLVASHVAGTVEMPPVFDANRRAVDIADE